MTTKQIDAAHCWIALIGLLALVCLFLYTGCSHLHVTNTTHDGRVFEASGWSFLWDRNLEGLQFDYEKGTLDIIDYTSNPDKETIGKAIDVIGTTLELMKAAAK
jgi:hypothetical protein